MPTHSVYVVCRSSSARFAASMICAGVGKSGVPVDRVIMPDMGMEV